MWPHKHLCLSIVLALIVGLPSCKKKPGARPDAGTKTTAKPAATVKPGEGTIGWPLADLRDAPGKKVIAKLKKGLRVTVLERREGWTRLRVVGGKAEGWVPTDAIEGGAPASSKAEAKPARAAAHPRYRVRARRANLRASARGRIVKKLLRGTLVTALRDEGEWLEVEAGDVRGWMARSVLTPVETRPPPAADGSDERVAVVRWPVVNLRSGTPGPKIGKTRKGARLKVLAQKKGWLKVRTPSGREGWLVRRAVRVVRQAAAPSPREKPAAEEAAPRVDAQETNAGRVRWSKVNMRRTPRGPIRRQLKRGARVKILERRGKWLKISAGGRTGWVATKSILISEGPARRDPQAGKVYQVTWSTVNLRDMPRGRVIDKLARGAKLRRLGSEEKWIKVETLDRKRQGWIVRRAVGLK